MGERDVNNKANGQENNKIVLLSESMPESTTAWLRYAAEGEGACSQVWEHIAKCKLCQFLILTTALMTEEDTEESEGYLEAALDRLERYKQQKDPTWNLQELVHRAYPNEVIEEIEEE